MKSSRAKGWKAIARDFIAVCVCVCVCVCVFATLHVFVRQGREQSAQTGVQGVQSLPDLQ